MVIVLGPTQPPFDKTKRYRQTPTCAHHVVRGTGSHQAGEFRLVLGISDDYNWRISQRGNGDI